MEMMSFRSAMSSATVGRLHTRRSLGLIASDSLAEVFCVVFRGPLLCIPFLRASSSHTSLVPQLQVIPSLTQFLHGNTSPSHFFLLNF